MTYVTGKNPDSWGQVVNNQSGYDWLLYDWQETNVELRILTWWHILKLDHWMMVVPFPTSPK